MEQVLKDKECGLYPSENTWKAIVDIVHGVKENLIGYSAHLSDVKKKVRHIRHAISDSFKSAFSKVYEKFIPSETRQINGGQRRLMVLNEKGKKYMNEHSVRGGISSYRWRKGDPYGSKTFRSLLLKLQSAHLDSVKMSKEEFPGLEFVKEDSNVSEVVISTIPVQILAFYIFKDDDLMPE